jgi:glycosyltransferase involved in cell wall biosynthesis
MTRATVILPTFGEAKFARWPIRSVQNQTVEEIEICVICDGSPDHMIHFFEEMKKDDPRIQVFGFAKAPRNGEPYRDEVIRKTSGKIICYCSHDDLWLPNHIEVVEKRLKRSCFTHTIHSTVETPDDLVDAPGPSPSIIYVDLARSKFRRRMLRGKNRFGLTFGAHRRESYFELEERWVTTPREDVATDLYMWQKFLRAFEHRCSTVFEITALNFPFPARRTWTEEERDHELEEYFQKIQDPILAHRISRLKRHLSWRHRVRGLRAEYLANRLRRLIGRRSKPPSS